MTSKKSHEVTLGNTGALRSRGFTYTSFNITLPNLDDSMIYHCRQLETCPTTGKNHWQGYIRFKLQHKRKELSKKYGKTIHWDVARGTVQQNRTYCSKLETRATPPAHAPSKGAGPMMGPAAPDCVVTELQSPRLYSATISPEFHEWGTIPQSQGHRSDLEEIGERVKLGCNISDIASDFPSQYIRYSQGIDKLKARLSKPGIEEKNCIWMVGPPGCGKSRTAYQIDPLLYSKPSGYWWDGYDGEKTILLDDFDGDIKYCELLKILDRYPLQVPIKGGFTWIRAKNIIITSNKNPKDFYPYDDLRALNRRISYRHIEDENKSSLQENSPTPNQLQANKSHSYLHSYSTNLYISDDTLIS